MTHWCTFGANTLPLRTVWANTARRRGLHIVRDDFYLKKVIAHSFRRSSFPNRTRCAGLRFGFGCRPENGGIHSVMILHNLSENSFWMRVFGHFIVFFFGFHQKMRDLLSHSLNQGLDSHHVDGSRHAAGKETQPPLRCGFLLSLAQQIVCASVPLHRSERMLRKAHRKGAS